MIVISSSDSISLHFPDEALYREYEREIKLIKIKYYKRIRDKYGVWASNQDRFVKSADDLNCWDSRAAEKLYDMYTRLREKRDGRLSSKT